MKVFLAPNTSDEEITTRARKKLIENGFNEDGIQINYNTQELEIGDFYISYDPPDLVIRNVYDKTRNGVVKMKSSSMIKI
jgi:hypothetical protein